MVWVRRNIPYFQRIDLAGTLARRFFMPDIILPSLTRLAPHRGPVRDESALADLLPGSVGADGGWVARLIAAGRADAPLPLTQALGLSRADLSALCARHCPAGVGLIEAWAGAELAGEDEVEEADLREILRAHGADPQAAETGWLAAIIARRALRPNHLWQDLGMDDRGQMVALLTRYFPALVARNDKDMKWKKFLYRLMCEGEGFTVCKSPVCEACCDFDDCFSGEG